MEKPWYVGSEEAAIVLDFLKTLPIGERREWFKSCETLNSCFSDVSLTVVSAFVSSLLFLVSAGAAESAHQTNTGRCSVSPPDGGTGHGRREHAETCGARARRGRGRGTPFQSKQEPRSVLKSNLILQFKDPTKLFSGKRREAQKPWRRNRHLVHRTLST